MAKPEAWQVIAFVLLNALRKQGEFYEDPVQSNCVTARLADLHPAIGHYGDPKNHGDAERKRLTSCCPVF